MKRLLFLLLAAGMAMTAHAHGDELHDKDRPTKPVKPVKPTKPTAPPATPAPTTPVAPAAAGAASPAPSFHAGGHAAAELESPQRLADGSLFVPKTVQRSLGLRTVAAQAGEFPRVIELPGRVIADPNAGGRVQATQAGTISGGPGGIAVVGQRVVAGQVLAHLTPSLEAANRADRQAALAELDARIAILGSRLARLQQLDGSVPRKELEQARTEHDSLQAQRRTLGTALGSRLALTAPASGVLAASHVVVGQVVEARELLFEIVDPRRLAVEALAYTPSQVQGLGRATARLEAAAEAGLDLEFVGAGRTLREQALPVLFRVRPGRGEMPTVAVGQTVKVLAETTGRLTGVVVPSSSIGRNPANETIVWEHPEAERFVPRRVRLAPLDATRVLVQDGLKGGERIVTSGAQSLGQIR